MGNPIGEVEEEILHVRRTPALNRFVFFLGDCVSQGDIDYTELEEIKSLMPEDEKTTFHLVLSACIDDDDLQKLFLCEKAEAVLTNLSFVTDNEELEKLSKEMYMAIVLGLNLIEECLCMIMTYPQMNIMKELGEDLTSKLTQEEFTKAITYSQYEMVLTSFVKLSRVQDELVGQAYRTSLMRLIENFVTVELPVPDCEKLATVFCLVGISLVFDEDFQNADEISVLLNEWQLDKTNGLMKSVSMKVYKALFATQMDAWKLKRLDTRILIPLDNFLSAVDAEKIDASKVITVLSQEIPLTNYIGGCAYLIRMLQERRSIELSDFPNLLKCTENLVKNKPKMKHEDITEDIYDFNNFCGEMKKYGDRDIYKRDWILKFLSFSAEEIIGTLEGSGIVESFIVGADYDVVLEFTKKIREVDKLVLDETQKDLIIRVITHEKFTNQEKQDFIEELFRFGANDKLEMGNFKSELHFLTLQLGNIEFEKDISKLDSHEYGVIRICLQNPVEALSKLLDQSCKTEHFIALELARPLFNLPYQPAEEEAFKSDLSPTLIVYSFYKLLKHIPEYPNAFYDSLSNSMELLLSHKILNESDMFAAIKLKILKILSSTGFISLPVVVGMVSLVENVLKFVSEEKRTEIGEFVVKLNRFFCQYTNSKTFFDAVKIKNILSRIIKFLDIAAIDIKREITKDTKKAVKDLSLFDQGLLYVRCDMYRPVIKKIMKKGEDGISFKDFVSTCVLGLILNCCEDEWDSLNSFIFNVAMSSTSKLHKIKSISKMNLLNKVLLLMYASSEEIKCTDAFLYTLRFYALAVESIQDQFGERDWYSMFHTLLTIGADMSRRTSKHKREKFNYKEVVGLHQVLSYALSKIEDFTKANVAVSFCSELNSLLKKFPVLDNKCEPVRWLILENFKQLLKNS